MTHNPYPILKNQAFIEPWEAVPTTAGDLQAGLYEHRDGRRHVYVWQDGENIQGREGSRDVTRIGYRTWPGEGVQFLGMSVSYGLRGARMGQTFFEHFMETVNGHEGMDVVETGLIYKPLVALTLARAGLAPRSTDCIVEILPRASSDKSDIPKINVISSPPNGLELVDRSPGGKFYEIVEPEDVIRQYPINDPGMTIALNTCYTVNGGQHPL